MSYKVMELFCRAAGMRLGCVDPDFWRRVRGLTHAPMTARPGKISMKQHFGDVHDRLPVFLKRER